MYWNIHILHWKLTKHASLISYFNCLVYLSKFQLCFIFSIGNGKHQNYKDDISSCGKCRGEIVLLMLHNSHFDIFMQKIRSPCPLRVGYWARVLTLASHTVLDKKRQSLFRIPLCKRLSGQEENSNNSFLSWTENPKIKLPLFGLVRFPKTRSLLFV